MIRMGAGKNTLVPILKADLNILNKILLNKARIHKYIIRNQIYLKNETFMIILNST